jgi:hypothetical protein
MSHHRPCLFLHFFVLLIRRLALVAWLARSHDTHRALGNTIYRRFVMFISSP